MAVGQTRALAIGVILVGLPLSGGCKTSGRTDGPLLVFPSPPDKPRVQFLTAASAAEHVEGPLSTIAKYALGDQPVNRPALDKPYGVAARDGVLYVCDTKLPALCRLDFKERKFTVLGVSGPGRLRKPINLAVDAANYKFVADPLRKQVVVFGPDERYVTAFDVPEPSHPLDVAIWGDELYVLDNDDTPEIVVMDRKTGEVLRTFGGPGEEPGQFKIPNSLCFGPDGYLYVSDTLNWRIQKLTREGEPVWTRGTPGYRLGQFGRPRGLRVGPDGIIYVADCATEIIQMFDEDGQILMHFGGPGSAPGALVLPAAVTADASSIPYFEQYIHKDFKADYLLFVTNQYGPNLISVYALGSFPEGYQLSEAQISSLPPAKTEDGQDTAESPPVRDEAAEQADEKPPEERQE